MTLLITIIAAFVATLVWYFNAQRDALRLGTLALMYWGAALMWSMDFAFEYAEMKAEYFTQPLGDVVNDALLGLAVVTLGLVAWLVILLVKDPKGVVAKKLKK